ncbi:MAG: hypothetical protein F7C36_04215 [Desulfurococcales archaeon]|nr:hypothetical protein [Desulfurococcales archaeon]
MKTIYLAIIVAVIAVGAVGAGYMIAKNTQPTPETQEETTGHGQGHGGMGQGTGQGGMMGEGSWMNMTTCNSLGNLTIGQSINWLFDHHSLFKFNYYEYPENKTIIWIITAPNSTAADILANHIKQMECVIENGGTPRPNDPVFQVDANITREYVNTTIIRLNETTIKVVKVAENDCAYEVIKLHAEIVQGFFTIGREEAMKTHEVPPEVESICQPYLSP